MKVKAQSEHYNATPTTVFDFISRPENLPKWAISYAQSVRKEGDDYYILTPAGEMIEIFEIDEKTGVIEMRCGPTKEQLWNWPCRVSSDNLGGSIVTFTCIQMPDQAEDEFDGQCISLKSELQNIRPFVEIA